MEEEGNNKSSNQINVEACLCTMHLVVTLIEAINGHCLLCGSR